MCDSPVQDFSLENPRNCKEISLFDPDTKDSGFHDDLPEDFEKLVSSPLSLEDNEATILCFSPHEERKDFTPGKGMLLGKKKRLFMSPDFTSPSTAAASGLKRLKIFDTDSEDSFLNKGASLNHTPAKKPFVSGADVPLIDIQKDIKNAVEKSENGEDLIGDFSRNYALPLVLGSHPDLKCISVETMRDILEGKYKDVLKSFTIIDSRYPYEFNGGHIRGAVNLFLKDDYLKLLEKPSKSVSERHILIFHCEFSKERGPNMVRQLRKEDRTKNAMNYPLLNYPEIYILEGGYKKFFQSFPEHCDPMEYMQMLHPEHADEMRFFRKKCKSSDDLKTSKKSGRSQTVRKFLSNDYF